MLTDNLNYRAFLDYQHECPSNFLGLFFFFLRFKEIYKELLHFRPLQMVQNEQLLIKSFQVIKYSFTPLQQFSLLFLPSSLPHPIHHKRRKKLIQYWYNSIDFFKLVSIKQVSFLLYWVFWQKVFLLEYSRYSAW